MHFIIAILGLIAGAAFWLYRIKLGADAGREVYNDVKGAVRRGQWSRKADARLIETLDDPREAAAILMVQIASYDGEVTAEQKRRIEDLMLTNFRCEPDEAQGLYSFGRMAVGQINDAANCLRHILRPVRDKLDKAEMVDLVDMLETVAEIEGAPTDRQRQIILSVRNALFRTNE